MIERLIASTAIAMAIIIVVPLSIALGIWIRNRLRERREDKQQMLLDMRKAVNRHTGGGREK